MGINLSIIHSFRGNKIDIFQWDQDIEQKENTKAQTPKTKQKIPTETTIVVDENQAGW